MPAKTLNRSFAAGELSPECYARIDLVRYQTGLAIARNVFTTPHGSALNRAGFGYLLESKDSTKRSVVLPFNYSTEQAYVLEFGDQYIRFHLNGGTLLQASQNVTGITQANPGVLTYAGADPSNGDWFYVAGVGGMTQVNGRYFKVANVNAGANTFELTSIHGGANINTTTYGAYTAGGTLAKVYEIASPYLEADLLELHITQSADVLTITHPDYAPRELSRLAAASWTLTAIAFEGGPFLDENTDPDNFVWSEPEAGFGANYAFIQGISGRIRVNANQAVFAAGDVGKLIKVRRWGHEGAELKPYWEAGAGYAVPGFPVRYGDNDYINVSVGTTGDIPPVHKEGIVSDGVVQWMYAGDGSGVAKITQFVSSTRVYATVQTLLPPSAALGYQPLGVPVTWAHNGDGATTSFALAGATSNETAQYKVEVDGVLLVPGKDFSITADAIDRIYLTTPPPVGVGNLTVEYMDATAVTPNWSFGAWSAESGYPGCAVYFGGRIGYGGSDDEPQNVWLSRSRRYKDFGKSSPIQDDDAIDVALADAQVNRVRDLVALKHLVALTSSRAWHLAGDQDNVLTPTTTAEPGDAVGISTVQAETVGGHALYVDAVGNAIHKLYYGSLPTGESGYLSEDLSILAEHLTRNKTIVDIAFQRKPYPILWCVRSDGYLLGLTYNPRHEVVGWHQHLTDGEFESVCVVNEGTEDALYAVVKRTINGRTVRNIERQTSRRFVTLEDCFFVDAGLTYDGAAATTITGLWHLEGEAVVGLADGAVFSKTVTGGQITLDAAASKVHVGLGYTADIQTLPLALQAEAAGQGTTKNVSTVGVRLIDSSGVMAGPNFDTLSEMLQREDEVYGDAPGVVNGLRRIPIDGTWGEDGQACVRQSNPLPLHVSQIVLEVALGG